MVIKMEMIVPKELYNLAAIERVIRNAMTETASAAKNDFQNTTRSWTNKPTFRTRWIDNGWGREVYTESEIYNYVNAGTRPHKIRVKKAPTLRFQTGYKPKTIVRKLLSQQGGASGPWVPTPPGKILEVNHPGTQAREFDQEIAEKWGEEWPRQLQRAIDAEIK